MANASAQNLVQNNTNSLISQANTIVSQCSGPNCNTSSATQTLIYESLSSSAQTMSYETIINYSIPQNTVIARRILQGYIDLAAAVATVYSFQCGAQTTNNNCVIHASSVIQAQNHLITILVIPINDYQSYVAMTSLLSIMSVILGIMIFIFIIFGIFELIHHNHKQHIDI